MIGWILAGLYAAVGVVVLFDQSRDFREMGWVRPFDLAQLLTMAMTWPIWLVAMLFEMRTVSEEWDD